MRGTRLALIAIGAIGMRTLAAQAPRDSTATKQTRPADVSLIADSVANHGDSLAAYKMLDSALRANKRDASAWHRYGMMAWSMSRSTRGQFINSSPQGIRWLLAADSAMHLAVTFAPESASFWRDLAKFYLNSGSVFVRLRAEDYITKGLKQAEKSGNPMLIAELADERGMILWRRYEGDANRGVLDEQAGASSSYDAAQAAGGVAIRRDQMLQPARSFSGFADYSESLQLFERAVRTNPLNARARHHIYMALAERKNWQELLAASSQQLKNAPWDYEGYLAIGLANQRLNHGELAAAAFDSALVLMSPEARTEYTRATRILPPHSFGQNRATDSTDFIKLTAGAQKSTADLFWAIVDPLAASPTNEFLTEFHARVAYSDLRWTSDDLDHRGANTDRGDIHIRFGPPDRIIGADGGSMWRYNSGFNVFFSEPPSFGTGRIPMAGKTAAEMYINDNPVRWDNVPISHMIQNIGVRVTAFRSAADSLDVVVAADIPTGDMVKDNDLGGALPFNISARVIDGLVKTHGIKSAITKIRSDSVPATLPQNWIEHIGPGLNLVRVEAYQPDTRRIARGLIALDTARSTGFGMSDVMLGTRLSESTATPERWRDVRVQPSAGTFRVGEAIGILWENYELKTDGGSVKYRVHINVNRDAGSGIANIAARIRSAFGNRILGQSNGNGDIEIAFPRNAPARNITVEAMSLDLGSVPAGKFHLKVEITDLVTGKKTSRTTEFFVVQ